MPEDILEFLDISSTAIILQCLALIISAIAVAIALYYNAKTQRQYVKSLEPQLSMRIDKFDGSVYLMVENTGKTAAKNIEINVHSIKNNGAESLMLDDLFSQTYELFPNETVQAVIALSGENISTGTLYPKIDIDVSYQISGKKQRVKYSRTVIFSKAYDAKIYGDIKMDLGNIESSLKSTARAAVRTANYLDGMQLCIFDEMNIVSDKSLYKDLSCIFDDKNCEK